MKNGTAFLGLNVLFAAFTLLCGLFSASPEVHPLYLILLFLICTSPMLVIKRANDRFVLLVFFAFTYFVFYGLLDLISLVSSLINVDQNQTQAVLEGPDGLISRGEWVILLGGALALIGYMAACQASYGTALTKDWPEFALVAVGGTLWLSCTVATWIFRVHLIVDTSNEATSRGLATLSSIQTAAFLLAELLQSVAIVILAYAQCRYRRSYMTVLIVTVVLVQLVYGFVVDIKSAALLGIALVVITKFALEGRVPKVWSVSAIVFVTLSFPILQANRWVRGEYGFNHAQAAEHLSEILSRAISAKDRPTTESGRAQTFFERSSLKGSVNLIVNKTGTVVAYERGYTLIPLVTALIPRIIWPDKLDVQAGQVMNRDFHVSEVADTYISPSHLGELYWNFGWLGVLLGMPAIGFILGTVGARCDLSKASAITRLLIVVMTARLLILGFEGTIAVSYAVWLRTLLAIGILDLILARKPSEMIGALAHSTGDPTEESPRFQNLLS